MPKQFYTERDIQDMFKRGIMSLDVSDNVVLTGLAYEKAGALGMKLLRNSPDNPPIAPVRPYVLERQARRSASPAAHIYTPSSAPQSSVLENPDDGKNLQQRIRGAVIARLGTQVDSNLLDVIIKRVLKSTGMKEPVCCSAESGAQRCAPSSTMEPRG